MKKNNSSLYTENCEGDLDYDFLSDLFPDRVESYINQWRTENNRLEHWVDVGWHVYKEKDCNRLGKMITAIVNESGSIVAGVDEECYKEILSYMKMVEYKPVDIYLGLEYAIVSEKEACIIWNMNLIRDVMEQVEKMELYYEDDVSYYLSKLTLAVL